MKLPLKLPKSAAARFLGVDIGHDNIKVIEVEYVRDAVRLTHAGMAPTPLHSVVEGQVVMPDLVGKAIREIVDRHAMPARQCIGSVMGSSVFVRPIGVPRQKPADLAQTIVFEAQKHVSTTSEESYFDYPILPDAAGVEMGQEMPVLLVVSPKALVDGRVKAMEAAGLEPISMDVSALAAIRVLLPEADTLSEADAPPTIAVVDLGASYTEVTITQGPTPVFSRTINIGGTSFTNALAGVLGVDFDEAQTIKHGLDVEMVDDSSPDATASRVVNSVLEELVRDIRRSLAYHASTMGWESIDGLVDRVVLIGGGSQLIHTADYFANVLQMRVEVGDIPLGSPLTVAEGARAAMGSWTPSFLTALGLALWPLYAGGKR